MKKILFILSIAVIINACTAPQRSAPPRQTPKQVPQKNIEPVRRQSYVEENDNTPETPYSTPRGFVYREKEPIQLNRVQLDYPQKCRDNGIQGTVMLEIEIFKSGNVGAVKVIKSVDPEPGGLDDAAKDFARQLKFEPAKNNGKPVAVWVRYPVTFSL